MTVNAFLVDGFNNTGRTVREALSALSTMGSTTRPLGGLSGVRPGTPASTVTVASGQVQVGPHSGLIDAEAAGEAGAYLYAVSATETQTLTPADASNARIDIVSIQISDPNEGDASPVGGAAVVYTAGIASATPAAPATPARSLLLAQINVPKVGGGNPTVTWRAPWIAAAGGEPVFMTKAGLLAWVPAAGPSQKAQVSSDPTPSNNGEYYWNGASWQAPRDAVQGPSGQLDATARTTLASVTFTVAGNEIWMIRGALPIGSASVITAAGVPIIRLLLGSTEVERLAGASGASVAVGGAVNGSAFSFVSGAGTYTASVTAEFSGSGGALRCQANCATVTAEKVN